MLQKQGFVLESHYAVQELKHQSLITHKHAMKANRNSSIFLLRSHPRASEPQKFHQKKTSDPQKFHEEYPSMLVICEKCFFH